MSAVDDALSSLTEALASELGATITGAVADSLPPIAVSVTRAAKLVHKARGKVQAAVDTGALLADSDGAVNVEDLRRWHRAECEAARRVRLRVAV